MKQLKNIITAFAVVILGLNASVYAQNKAIFTTSIKGIVIESATGKPLSGANITIKDVTSVISDEKGEFEINRSIPDAKITVSLPGFATRQIPLNNKENLIIKLMDESFKGKYEDITLPFATKNAYNSAYSVSSHENRDDYKLGASTIDAVFQGKLNGLNTVSRTGMPGAGANLFINGFTSLNANNQPLIIIDGVQYENPSIYSLIEGNNITPLSDLDVKDIDKITVLKDGTSIYGSKGANGVILINTIRAKSPATRINFYTYAGVNFETESKYPMLDAWGYKNYLTDMLLSKGLTTNEVQALPYINNQKPVVENWGVSGNADYYRYNQYTNWQNEVLNSSINQNYHLNVSGGNDVILYAIGVGFLNHEGAVDKSSFSRYTFRTNASIKMTEWFSMNANVSYINSERLLAYEGMNRNFNPLYSGLIKSPFTASNIYNVLGERTPNLEDVDMFNISNPTAIINNSSAINNRSRFSGILNGIININKDLNADIIFGITSDKVTKERIFMPKAGVFHTPLPLSDVTNESKQLRNNLMQINADAKVTYKKIINFEHDITARLGFRYLVSKSELDWGQAFNSSSDEMQTLGSGINALAQIGGSLGSWNSVSNYLNFDYGLRNKYFVSINAALDGSSRFGKEAAGLKLGNNVFGFFPSVNAAWLLTSEEFMSNQTLFDILKVRTGYSIAGNDDIGNYTARYYYIPQSFVGSFGLVRGNVPNPKLKWETTNKATFGIDASFLDEKLNLSIDLYSGVTKDLIAIRNLETYSGIPSAVLNDGSVRNTGIDLNINGRIIDKKDWKFDMGLNLSTYKNTVVSMSENYTTEIAGGTVLTQVGSPFSQFYGYKTDGILNSTAEATEANLKIVKPDGTIIPFVPGDVKFVDLNNDGIINDEDKTIIGNPNPDFAGSINATLQWKNFTLSAICGFSVGNDVYNAVRASLESLSGTDNQTMAAANRWKYNGQETTIPAAIWGDPRGNSRFSDRWIEDGSYLRMKSISLSYDIPFKSAFINNAQVYVTANNLLTFTKYLGYDPEFSTGQSPLYYGIDRGVTPQPRTVLLGVKIGL